MKLITTKFSKPDALKHYQEQLRQALAAAAFEAVIDKANAIEQYREATGQSFPRPELGIDYDEQELLTTDPGYRDWMAQQETKD